MQLPGSTPTSEGTITCIDKHTHNAQYTNINLPIKELSYFSVIFYDYLVLLLLPKSTLL